MIPNRRSSRPDGNVVSAINSMKSLGNPQTAFNQLYQSNPQFRQFADSMRGKTPEQAFRDYGLDFNQFRNLF